MPKIDLQVLILTFGICLLTPITTRSQPASNPDLPAFFPVLNLYSAVGAPLLVQAVFPPDPVLVFSGLPPATQVVECQAPVPLPNVSASSNCPGTVNTTLKEWTSHDPGSCVNDYVIWREWTAADNCGNTAVFTGKIVVKDRTPPVWVNVPPDITGDCVETLCPFPPEAIDLCGDAFISYFHEGSRCEPGKIIITRTWVASDHCLNTTRVIQTAVALDDTPPVPRDVPASVTIQVGDPLPPMPAPWGDDLCYPAAETTIDYRQETFSDRVLRIWTFCDCASNCIADTQQILITNNLPPEFSGLPSGVFATSGISCFEFDLLLDEVQAFDPPNYTPVPVDYSSTVDYDVCGQRNTTTVTFLATDNAGLSTTASIPIRLLEDNCLPFNYCSGGPANAGVSWIQKVKFGNSIKNSQASAYSDFTSTVFQALAGGIYSLELTPNLVNSPAPLNWAVWLDLNRDGAFDNQSERVSIPVSVGVIAIPLHIPVNTATGIIRMRIALSTDVLDQACGQFTAGEVEDYHIRVKGPDCLPDVCAPAFNQQTQLWEYISRVRLGGTTNLSGPARYSDFRQWTPTPVERGKTYPLVATANSKIGYYGSHFWDIYADFNRDGDFNDAFELIDTQSLQMSRASFNLHIPTDAVPGKTTLRLVLSRDASSNACGMVGYGEIEDYALEIVSGAADSSFIKGGMDERQEASTGKNELQPWTAYPNPATDRVELKLVSDHFQTISIRLAAADGQIKRYATSVLEIGVNTIALDVHGLPGGTYFITVKDDQSIGTKILLLNGS